MAGGGRRPLQTGCSPIPYGAAFSHSLTRSLFRKERERVSAGMIGRRGALAGAGAITLARPAVAQPARVLRMVPQANLASLDPIWSTANITRNHGFMVYDTLYGLTADLQPTPQMAAGHSVEDDGRRVAITLRDGLLFHDGEPVLAADAMASLRRWMARNPFGQKLATVVDELAADGDRRIVFRLSRPFPLLFHALAAVSIPAFIMPARIAATDPFKQVDSAVGSGPFRFKRDEFNSGSLVVYERNPAYVPVDAPPSLTAGGKVAGFGRVEWRILSDAATASAALQTGEVDWFEQPPPELQTLLRRNRGVTVEAIGPLPNMGVLRLNHLHPPFNDPALRRALLPAIEQADFMAAIVGTDPGMVLDRTGVFAPGTANASEAGLEPLLGPRSVDAARAAMRDAGYTNQPMRLIGPTDILAPTAMTQVGADLFRRLGFNKDLALSDWGTVIQRRANREPLERGGWSALLTAFTAYDFVDPALHPLARGNGVQGWPGWPTIPRLEALRDAWFDAGDDAVRTAICADMQRVVVEDVAWVPVGGYVSNTALRRDLAGRVPGFAIFWGIRPG